MLNEIEKIHSAARRYCIKGVGFWVDVYTKGASFESSNLSDNGSERGNGQSIFPRYLILGSILRAIEESTPQDFATIEELKSYLAMSAYAASDEASRLKGLLENNAMHEERVKAADYFAGIGLEVSMSEELLPYRRTLTSIEAKALRKSFRSEWGNWYGGVPDVIRPTASHTTLTLHSKFIDSEEAVLDLQRILENLGWGRVFELREDGTGEEIDLVWARFSYNLENFWFPGDFSAMIYASHESSITFGGQSLIDALKAHRPDWNRYIYKGYDLSLYEIP